MGTPRQLGSYAALAVNVFFGMVAGFVGLYAIKLDTTRMLLLSLARALLCGFAWKSTLEAGRELVITRMQEGHLQQQLALTQQTINGLTDADPEKAAIYIIELESLSLELMRSSNAVRHPTLRAEADRMVAGSVEALGGAALEAPEVGARALGSVGAAAMAQERPAVSRVAAGSLVRLAEEKRFEPEVSSEVSNSLLNLSGATRVNQREDKASALRQQSIEVFRQAEQRISPDDRDPRGASRGTLILSCEMSGRRH